MRRIGRGLEADWRRIGGGLEEDWRWIGGGLEEDWRRIGGGLEEDWKSIGGAGKVVPRYVELVFLNKSTFFHQDSVNIIFETREGRSELRRTFFPPQIRCFHQHSIKQN